MPSSDNVPLYEKGRLKTYTRKLFWFTWFINEENEIGKACSMRGVDEVSYKILVKRNETTWKTQT
jgi:hypothetical protein